MRVFLLAAISLTLFGAATDPISVLRVIDGDTIEVEGSVGGQLYPVRVRLLFVDTPELDDADPVMRDAAAKARQFLIDAIDSRKVVLLSEPGDAFERDAQGNMLAYIIPQHPHMKSVVNARVMRAGWSAYWQKHGSAKRRGMHNYFTESAGYPRARVEGMWRINEQWMLKKKSERPIEKESSRTEELLGDD